MDRYVCIHAHFYQPPRENPWLEAIEVQDSAKPYHDWNERVTDECYAPNAAARTLDAQGLISGIVNNYARISFNFGPTLLAWLADRAPDVYRAVLEADRDSERRFSGHGSALAQPYNHMILPLAEGRDKRTQILWGVRDFEKRFGRRPEGMWLPETAVDLESLELLAEQGVRFTILAPHQAGRVRRIGGRSWRDVRERIDPSRPYLLRLRGSGRQIAIFFYDGPISQAVAFEGLLANGERFATRLLGSFSDERDGAQLTHIATDGETYGHHHRRGEMALAYALDLIDAGEAARLTNYGEFLERHPPTHEIEIVERTSWSCAHGVERWWRDCGCDSGTRPEWDQSWRTPLRNALDGLRDALAPRFADEARKLLTDPWAARDSYIAVLLDRSRDSRDRFLAEHAVRPLADEEQVTVWKWLELQRHAMLMYTSCGWFFDDLSGIETVQVIQYAGRVLQLASELLPAEDHEAPFLSALAEGRSNLPEQGNGAEIYARYVRPAMVDLRKVGAHYAIASLFAREPETPRIYCYEVDRGDHRRLDAGAMRLVLGHARVTSEITRESERLSYAVLHFGDHNLSGAVRRFRGADAFAALADEVAGAFERGDVPTVLRLIDRHFEGRALSLGQLFRDEQRRVMDEILRTTLAATETSYRQMYERHGALMRYLRDSGIPIPAGLRTAVEIVVVADLRRALSASPLDVDAIGRLTADARAWGIELPGDELRFTLERSIDRVAERLSGPRPDPGALLELEQAVDVSLALPFRVELRKSQNAYVALRRAARARPRADAGLIERLAPLGEKLGVAPTA